MQGRLLRASCPWLFCRGKQLVSNFYHDAYNWAETWTYKFKNHLLSRLCNREATSRYSLCTTRRPIEADPEPEHNKDSNLLRCSTVGIRLHSPCSNAVLLRLRSHLWHWFEIFLLHCERLYQVRNCSLYKKNRHQLNQHTLGPGHETLFSARRSELPPLLAPLLERKRFPQRSLFKPRWVGFLMARQAGGRPVHCQAMNYLASFRHR